MDQLAGNVSCKLAAPWTGYHQPTRAGSPASHEKRQIARGRLQLTRLLNGADAGIPVPMLNPVACSQCNAPMNRMYATKPDDGWIVQVYECPQCWFVHTEVEREPRDLQQPSRKPR